MSDAAERKRLAETLRRLVGFADWVHDDLRRAADLIDPPAPPEGTVRVRIAVSATSEDEWMSYGAAWSDDDSSSDYAMDNTSFGARLTWVTADVPLPAPPAEVEGRAE